MEKEGLLDVTEGDVGDSKCVDLYTGEIGSEKSVTTFKTRTEYELFGSQKAVYRTTAHSSFHLRGSKVGSVVRGQTGECPEGEGPVRRYL